MTKIQNWIEKWLSPIKMQNRVLEFLQRRCQHDPDWVSVDILEGDFPGLQIRCCNRCGAVRIVREDELVVYDRIPEWRAPRASWTERIVF